MIMSQVTSGTAERDRAPDHHTDNAEGAPDS